MKIQDLLSELQRLKINEEAYRVLPRNRIEGAICLAQEADGQWLVSLVERGDSVIENYFEEEGAACRYFLKYLISDPTYFKDFSMKNYENLKARSAELLKYYEFV